jgi:hypothetical protein
MTQPMRESDEIRHIPIERIEILNPRERNQKVFREIVASIQALGLKKPITVTRRGEGAAERFVLVCGQGRVEAFKALGQSTIPALVVASDEEAFVISLVENIARRQTPPFEQLETIRALQQRGHQRTRWHGADGEIFAPFDQALPVRRLAVLLPDFSEHGVAESLEVLRLALGRFPVAGDLLPRKPADRRIQSRDVESDCVRVLRGGCGSPFPAGQHRRLVVLADRRVAVVAMVRH